jgi:hypothetical protein
MQAPPLVGAEEWKDRIGILTLEAETIPFYIVGQSAVETWLHLLVHAVRLD